MCTNPSDRTSLHLRILLGFVAALAAYHIGRLLVESSQSSYYYEYTVLAPLKHKFTFPYLAVCVSVGLLITEAVLLMYALARKAGRLWMRAVSCLLVLLP